MKRSLHYHLPKIATLDLLVQTGSFRAASARAHVTQSALSQAISTLEDIFGYPLLVRENGHVRPTPACMTLLDRVRPALQAINALASDTSPSKAEVPNISSLDLGSYESLAINVLPALTVRLKSIYPSLHLTVKIGRSGELIKMVRKGDLCMAITTELDSTDGLSILPLAEDRLGVFVSTEHRQAKAGRCALDDIWLGSLSPAKEGHPRYFARYLRTQKLPKPVIVSESFEALRAMAVEGAIAAVLPARVANRERGGKLTELDLGTGRENGRHKIQLVSPKNCDPHESEFLAAELRVLFN